MKYIRMKDGVYKITHDGLFHKEAISQNMLMLVESKNEKEKKEYREIETHIELSIGKNKFKEHIINQADTIEELCDEFVCEENHFIMKPIWLKFDEEGNPTETYHEGILNAIKGRYFNSIDYRWFGAIWTDKGLIYVAKMNEKGELELL